jgi:AcrR family transcriptional regulator
MVKVSRKQMEIQQREADILQISRRMLLESGYESLSMEKLAAELKTAKGTLYNHFPNKEEIVLALVCQALQVRQKMFGIAAMAFGDSRMRMMAVGAASQAYVQRYSEHFAIEQFVSNSTIRGKTKEKSHELIRHFEIQCMESVGGIVRDAVMVGDLTLPSTLNVSEFVYGFWAISFGSHVLTHQRPGFGDLGISDPWRAIRQHCCCMLNGFNWKPLMNFDQSHAAFLQIEGRLDEMFAHTPHHPEKILQGT